MSEKEKDIKIEVKIEESIATGSFANFSNISHSPDEYIIDFLFIHPAPPPGFGKLVSRVILTPAHAKKLLGALGRNIHEYESRFGEIKIEYQQRDIGNLQ